MTLNLRNRLPARTDVGRIGSDRNYLSFSSLASYRACPLRYYFHYVAGLPEESISASLIFGTAIHRALELHFRRRQLAERATTADELLSAYHAAWAERSETPVEFGASNRQELDRLALRMLTAFQAHPAAQPPGVIRAVEAELRGPLTPGLPDLVARIDLLTETDEEFVIHDWKTSRQRWSPEQVESASEQLLLYAALVRPLAPRKRLRLEFVVLTKTREVSVECHSTPATPQRIDRTLAVAQRVWQAIEAQHFYPAPSPLQCPGCAYRQACRQWTG